MWLITNLTAQIGLAIAICMALLFGVNWVVGNPPGTLVRRMFGGRREVVRFGAFLALIVIAVLGLTVAFA